MNNKITKETHGLRLGELLNFKKVGLLSKDFPTNPCREIVARRIHSAASDNLKAKLL
ncbi:MAG: hypothetical protein LBN96_05055 [Desulfovibrio sp.]|nr:hypothetical protein [Desulfovibrio sp.]